MLSGECREYSGGVRKHQARSERASICMVLSAHVVSRPPTVSRKHYQIVFQKPDYFSSLINMEPANSVFLPQGGRQRV